MDLKLTKNLRKSIKRGHPWVYKDAIELKRPFNKPSSFATLKDQKGLVTQGIFDATSPIAFRALDFNPSKEESLKKSLQFCIDKRKSLKKTLTTGYRLINGEGDGFSGLICDRYSEVLVLQYDGPGMEDFWSGIKVSKLLIEMLEDVKIVVYKARGDESLKHLFGEELKNDDVEFLENGLRVRANILKGQKTGFFFDQRDNRNYIKNNINGKTLLNAFSYTGGFSVYAGFAGLDKVVSLDLSPGAINDAKNNWLINDLESSKHEGLSEDAFKFFENNKTKFDSVIVDPPSMTSSQKTKTKAIQKYKALFASAANSVAKNGSLILSSCSSQIGFTDFEEIVIDSLSEAQKKGKVMRFSGQGLDHPYPHFCPELRYLKFMHLILD